MKRRANVFIFLLLFSILLSGCGFSDSSKGDKDDVQAKKEKVIHLSLDNDIPDLNQVLTTDAISFSILNNVMEGLYRLDENNEPQPAMAERVDISEDKLTYTFHLRDNIKWSNGDPVIADDFKYSWLRAMHPDTAGPYADILYDFIEGGEAFAEGEGDAEDVAITVIDEKTLAVKLKDPTPFFLDLTAFVTYFPLNEKFVKEVGEDNFGLRADTILYNGPFIMTAYDQAKGVTLEKNDQYWDKDQVELDKATLKVIKEHSTALNLYEAGELDRVYLSSADVKSYKDSPDFGTETQFITWFIQFNLGKKPFDNDHIRKAFQLAYDPKVLADTILKNGSEAAYALVAPRMNGLADKDFRELNGNIVKPDDAKAKELLAKGIEESGELPPIEILTQDDTVAKDTATFLQSEFKKNLGVDVKIVTKPYSARLDTMRADQYQLVISKWGADYNDAMTYVDLWIGEPAKPFRGSYFNQEYNESVQQALSEMDEKKRLDFLMKAEKILLDDAVIGPLYYEGRAYLQKPYIKGYVSHPYGASLELKGIKLESF